MSSAALVTGASSGIGAAFARALAADGRDVVLVARREDRLRALAGEIEHDTGRRVHVVPTDLADPGAPAALTAELDRRKVVVDVLVNNAGFGVPGPLLDAAWQRHRDCLEVMAVAPVHLAYRLAPAMIARRRGHIVNVSSLAALLPPHAGGTLYYPVKSFLLQASLALRAELRPFGVHVTALCPGFTRTGFQQASGGTVERLRYPCALWMGPGDVAGAGLAAVARDRAVCIPGLHNRAIALAFKLLPGGLARRLAAGPAG